MTRKQNEEYRVKKDLMNWTDPRVIGALLVLISIAWIAIAVFLINSFMYRVTLITASCTILVVAVILYFKHHHLKPKINLHESIVGTLFESRAVALTLIDHQYRVIELNHTKAELLGYEHPDDLIGKSIMDFIEPTSKDSFHEALLNVTNGTIEKLNIFVLNKSSFPLELQVSCEPLRRGNQVIGSLIISHDLSDQKRSLERIRYMAYYDDMTGLPNRTLFQIRLDEYVLRAKEEQTLLGVCYVDLDNFKLVNASFGREIADLMLLQIADRLNRTLTSNEFVARMEGDEFALLFLPVESIDQMLEKAREIIRIIEEPYDLRGIPVHITAKMGISLNINPMDDAYTLFKKADTALVRVKESASDTILIFSDGWSNSSYEKLTLQHELYRAIQRHEFILHYQPQYDLTAEKIVGMEALIRWNHPTKGLLSPLHFIPLAEESGLIVQIGEWVLREACRQNKEWLDEGLPIVPVAVNLSIRQFLKNDMEEQINQILKETGLEPQYLDIEITESMSVDINEMNEKLYSISQLGVGISVDDFGTGYSSFHYLKSFPISRLKIDRSFMKDIQTEKSHSEIVSAIIAMAHKLNLQVIAEGVETMEQLEFLKAHHCDEIQGYLKSPPIPGEQFKEVLLAG